MIFTRIADQINISCKIISHMAGTFIKILDLIK